MIKKCYSINMLQGEDVGLGGIFQLKRPNWEGNDLSSDAEFRAVRSVRYIAIQLRIAAEQ